MRQLRHLKDIVSRRPRAAAGVGFLVALFGCAALARADRLPTDPVEDLRQVLKQDSEGGKSKNGSFSREADLKKRVAAVKSLGDLSRALLLSEWRDSSTSRTFETDREARKSLADRFTREVGRVLEKGDPVSRAAAAGLVGDTAKLARERDAESDILQSAFDELATGLIKAIKDPDSRVQLQAIRSLGRIQVEPAAKTIAPLGQVFGGESSANRRASAEALNNLIHMLPQVRRRREKTGELVGSGLPPASLRIETCNALIPAAGKGLNDSDVEVRRQCADTLFQTGEILSDSFLIEEAMRRIETPLPPEGRKLTDSEKKEKEEIELLRKEFPQLLRALRDVAPALAKAGGDADATVRVRAVRALEQIGAARQVLLRRAATAPEPEPAPNSDRKKTGLNPDEGKREDGARAGDEEHGETRYAAAETEQPPAPAADGQDPLLEGLKKTIRPLAKALNDPKPDVRLAAVEALEKLGNDAAPAAATLSWALTDPDRFVRWAAARTLGRMNPDKVPTADVVKNLTRMLDDPDLDLRLIAAQSLERYGPAAKAAVPALARATGRGDAEIRRAAIRSLVAIGTDATSAVPDIAAAMSNRDVRVRRSAAEALSLFGEHAKPVEADLRKALDDSDAEVRRHAEDALLKIK